MEKSLKKQVLEFLPLKNCKKIAAKIVHSFQTPKFLAKIVDLNNRLENEPELDEYLEKMMDVFKIYFSESQHVETVFLNPTNTEHAKTILQSGYKDLLLAFSKIMTQSYLDLYKFLISLKTDEEKFLQAIQVIFGLIKSQIDGDPAIYNQSKQIVLKLSQIENQKLEKEKNKIQEEKSPNFEKNQILGGSGYLWEDEIFMEAFREMLKSEDSIIRMRGMELVCSVSDKYGNISQKFYEAKVFAEIVRLYSAKEEDLLESLNIIDILANFVSVKVNITVKHTCNEF